MILRTPRLLLRDFSLDDLPALTAYRADARYRRFYPETKLTTANYKGFEARCEGLLCIKDMSKMETIEYFDDWEDQLLMLRYDDEVIVHANKN